MPDANLFKQNCAGVVFWSGVFETEPVALFLECGVDGLSPLTSRKLEYTLYKVMASGSLAKFCSFSNGTGTCWSTGRKLSLAAKPDSQTIYISTIEEKPPKINKAWTFSGANTSNGSKTKLDDYLRDFFSKSTAAYANDYFSHPHSEGKVEPNKNNNYYADTPKRSGPLNPLIHCFEYLGVSGSPTAEEIKSAFRAKLKITHPDHNQQSKSSEDKTKDLITARDEANRRMGYK